MITVISGTNRKNSRTLIVAETFATLLKDAGAPVQVLDLAKLDFSYFSEDMYSGKGITPKLVDLQEQYILGASKLAFFLPEYNGSFPGIVKLFIDGISVNEYGRNFKGKVIAMAGVASGRSGNLRGMDHLATSLAYMGGWILPNKLPVSGVEGLLDESEKLVDAASLEALKAHAQQLIAA